MIRRALILAVMAAPVVAQIRLMPRPEDPGMWGAPVGEASGGVFGALSRYRPPGLAPPADSVEQWQRFGVRVDAPGGAAG